MFPAHFRTEPEYAVQTVEEHCRNAAEYACRSLDAVGLGATARLAGLIHDCGKYTDDFAVYITAAANGEALRRGSVNHTFAGVRLILGDIASEYDSEKARFTAELIAIAAGAHHGLFDCIDEHGDSGFDYRVGKEGIKSEQAIDNFYKYCADKEELKRLFEQSMEEVYNFAQTKILKMEGIKQEQACFYYGLLARLLLSAVIEGDRRDTAEFEHGDFLAGQEVTAETWCALRDGMEQRVAKLKADSEINRARAEISEICYEKGGEKGSLYRLNVPTGGGKTIASLRFALNRAATSGKKRIIYVMPLLAIIEQNASVIREYIGDDSIILEHHSNVVQTENSADNLNPNELMAQTWGAPVIITTLVQLLQTLFDGKTTGVRRLHSLCDSIIIFDEVQSVPVKLLSMFNLAVNFLTRCMNAVVVLCSATQPYTDRLCNSILPTEEIVKHDEKLWLPFKRTEIVPVDGRMLDGIAEFAGDVLEECDSLLIICNRKDEVQKLYGRLSGGGRDCYHLSAAMCAAHRRQTLDDVRRALADAGKEHKVICVSTQVIEAGVDISFQSVIRLSAGMDSVVQAAGRCNRNGEAGGIAKVYVVPCVDEELRHLEEIKDGKDATEALLDDYGKNPEKYSCDLTSDYSIAAYYNGLYGLKSCSKFDFDIDRHSGTLLDMLSSNSHFVKNNCGSWFNQSFKKAGELFKVFDDNTFDVIVPYREGEEIITELYGAKARNDIQLRRSLLSEARQYSVAVRGWQKEKLGEMIGAVTDADGNTVAFTLNKMCYNDSFGLTDEPQTEPSIE